ncbi:MAG: hypothetical protein US76_04040 [Parcubacteria group bacterium GW2011_GWA2_38_13b]|nr:MAG: hypothetical protein US76_04040 [Parcubacteria group bacterium GW2011_GWA2_38_13b]
MKKGRIAIDAEVCKGCDFCIAFCPKKLIKKGPHPNGCGFCPAVFSDTEEKCNACKICGIVCPDAAIEVFQIGDCENCDDCKCEKEGDNG